MKTPRGIEQLKKTVTDMVLIPDNEWEVFVQHLSVRTFEEKEYLVRAGDVIKNFYFIVNGIMRFFYSTEDGKEFNKHFAMENGIAGSLYSFLTESPCDFSIQALEKTETIVLPDLTTLNYFHDRHPCWERLSRRNAESLVFIKEAREKELLLDSLAVRYQRFLREFPGLSERIAQYHTASFLGVTDVALSRTRQKIIQ